LVTDHLAVTINKKNKSGIPIKANQMKNHLWLFANCLIVNPTFDSQTKENMTSQPNTFGSKCVLSDKFKQSLLKKGIIEAVLAFAQYKQDRAKDNKLTGKKSQKIKGISKLDDANNAGTKKFP
jgi:DNA topoisomerase-2